MLLKLKRNFLENHFNKEHSKEIYAYVLNKKNLNAIFQHIIFKLNLILFVPKHTQKHTKTQNTKGIRKLLMCCYYCCCCVAVDEIFKNIKYKIIYLNKMCFAMCHGVLKWEFVIHIIEN